MARQPSRMQVVRVLNNSVDIHVEILVHINDSEMFGISMFVGMFYLFI